MIVLVSDFGLTGPYVGQMKAVLYRSAPGVPVVDLFADIPSYSPRAGAYLLGAYAGEFPEGTVFLGVVDPGVGTASREPVAVQADGRWYVGPDNGLFDVVGGRAERARAWRITWRPERLSASFHGRDLFAPVAATLARGGEVPGVRQEPPGWVARAWPGELDEVVYIDHYGNTMTGRRAGTVPAGRVLVVDGRRLRRLRTFGDAQPGEAFWYENSNGLAEIASNQGNAARELGLAPGQPVTFEEDVG